MQVQRIQNYNAQPMNNKQQSFGWLKIKQSSDNMKILNDLAHDKFGAEFVETLKTAEEQMKNTKFFHIYLGDNLKPKLLSTRDAFWGNFIPIEKRVNGATQYNYKQLNSDRKTPIVFNQYKYYGYSPLMSEYDLKHFSTYGMYYETIERLNNKVAEEGLIPYNITEYGHEYDYGCTGTLIYDSIGSGLSKGKYGGYTNSTKCSDYLSKLVSMAKELEKLSKNAE